MRRHTLVFEGRHTYPTADPPSLPIPPAWIAGALCAQTDPEAFYPEKGGSTKDAKAICSMCAVRSQCLEYAMEMGERFGIFGGLSAHERRRLKAARRAA